MTDKEDGSISIPNLVLKNNGIPIGTTNKRGDVFLVNYQCSILKLSGANLFYKYGELKATLKAPFYFNLKLEPFKVSKSADKLIDYFSPSTTTQCLKIPQKSRNKYCERSEQRLHFDWTKVH